MPISFTKDEVKEFLEEQGFDVSDERTLKNFIHDLKKLIKYEDMQRRRKKLGHLPDETNLDSTDGRHPYTTTSSTQNSSSPYEGEDNLENDENSHQQFQEAVRVSSSGIPVSSKKSFMKKLLGKSPVRQQRSRQELTGDTGSYGTDGATSHDHADHRKRSKDEKQMQRPQPTREPKPKPLSGNVIRSEPTSTAPPPPKKKGNRLIMKRVTASQDINGDSVLEESDIDLGPVRRQFQPPKKNPTAFARPKTAPQIKSNKPEEAGSSKSRPESRPTSSRSQNINPGDVLDKNKLLVCDPEDLDPDELFHALSELIFPLGKLGSDDSLLAENDNKTKTLLKPPPHVARDPVLLYHWYKNYNWDIYTIPGEDRHMKLRWNVRAKTVGGYHPCVETRHIPKPKSAR